MALKGHPTSEAAKQKLREAALGRKHTDAAKQKMSDARRGQKRGPCSEATKKKIGDANRGRKHTDDHNRKIGEALKGRKHSAATRRKIAKANKGKKRSPEQCAHLSKIRKGKPAPWVRERFLGKKRPLSKKGRAALVRSLKARRLPDDERERRRKETNRHCQLMSRYGLSATEYDKLLEEQGGVCRICRCPCSTGKRLAVDHDHATNKVRGLLCRRCNRGLGHFPTVEVLRRALAYAKGTKC